MSSPGPTFNLTCGKGVTELQNLTNLRLSSFAKRHQMQQKNFDVALSNLRTFPFYPVRRVAAPGPQVVVPVGAPFPGRRAPGGAAGRAHPGGVGENYRRLPAASGRRPSAAPYGRLPH